MKSVGAAIAAAAGNEAADGGQAGGATATAAWVADMPANEDADWKQCPACWRLRSIPWLLMALTSSPPTQWAMTTPPPCQTQCQVFQRRWRFPAHVRHFEWRRACAGLHRQGAGHATGCGGNGGDPREHAESRLTKLRLWVSSVMMGQASRVPSTMIITTLSPAIKGTFTCTGDSCSLVIRAAGTMSWSRPRPATRFPEEGKALRLWKLMRRQTTSSSVSGWMK